MLKSMGGEISADSELKGSQKGTSNTQSSSKDEWNIKTNELYEHIDKFLRKGVKQSEAKCIWLKKFISQMRECYEPITSELISKCERYVVDAMAAYYDHTTSIDGRSAEMLYGYDEYNSANIVRNDYERLAPEMSRINCHMVVPVILSIHIKPILATLSGPYASVPISPIVQNFLYRFLESTVDSSIRGRAHVWRGLLWKTERKVGSGDELNYDLFKGEITEGPILTRSITRSLIGGNPVDTLINYILAHVKSSLNGTATIPERLAEICSRGEDKAQFEKNVKIFKTWFDAARRGSALISDWGELANKSREGMSKNMIKVTEDGRTIRHMKNDRFGESILVGDDSGFLGRDVINDLIDHRKTLSQGSLTLCHGNDKMVLSVSSVDGLINDVIAFALLFIDVFNEDNTN